MTLKTALLIAILGPLWLLLPPLRWAQAKLIPVKDIK